MKKFEKTVTIRWLVEDEHQDCDEAWLAPANIALILNKYCNEKDEWIQFTVEEAK